MVVEKFPVNFNRMKRICIVLAIATCFAACGNNSNSGQDTTDSTNSVTLPENRSSDSLAVPSDSLTQPRSGTTDSMGVRSDSTRR